MHLLFLRYIWSVGNVVFSLFLGLIALGYCVFYQRPFLLQLFKQAGQIRDHLVTLVNWPDAEILARTVLHESTLVVMFFTIGARIVIGFVQLIWGIVRGT